MESLFYIQSKRVTLRPLKIEDNQQIFEYAKNMNVSNYLNWDNHKNIKETNDYIKRIISLYKYFPTCNLGIILNKDDSKKIIGTVGLLSKNPSLPFTYELGFVLGENWWGNGYAYEAVNSLLSYSFKKYNIQRIEAYCVTENTASFRLLEKIGMQKEGIIKQNFFKNNLFYDLYLYSILKKDWNSFK